MNKNYPHLLSPIRIKGVRFRNRVMASPTLPAHITPEGFLSQNYFSYFEAKAFGGAGLVSMGETAVDWDYGRTHDAQICLWGKDAGIHLANLVDGIHRGGALANIQLCHGGIWSHPAYNGDKNPIGPSACVRPDGVQVDEMTEYQIEQVAENFAESAACCKNAGFDMIMIHAAHGWLLSNFLSPFNNRRTDKWGGSPENRARFPLLVLDKIRDAVGEGMLLDMRVSVGEGLPGGLTEQEALEFIKMAQDRLDTISPSKGNRWDIKQRGEIMPSIYTGGYGSNLYLSQLVRDAGIKLPIIAMGALNNPDVTEKALADGIIDFAGMGHGLIAEPEWTKKIMDGRRDEVRPCLRCSRCADIANGRENNDLSLKFNTKSTHRFNCSVNPEVGRWHYKARPLGTPRKVAVVGGGPAGMQAAITAVERGHKVTLFEKSSILGGQLKFADNVKFKAFVKEFKEYQINMLGKRGVDVRLNTEVTPEMLKGFDTAIIAVGSAPIIPAIPGINESNVITAIDSFERESELGKKLVIIGGGQVGCECALHMAMQGHDVSIVEMKPMVAEDCIFSLRVPLVIQMEKYNVNTLTDTRCVEVTKTGVKVSDKDGNEYEIDADTVILAAGSTPRHDFVDDFDKTEIMEILPVGDCIQAKTIFNATSTGYDAAMNVM